MLCLQNCAVAAVAVGLTLAGCSGDKPAGGTSATVAGAVTDPCSLISESEVAAITTDAVGGTTRREQTCTYLSKPSDGAQVTVKANGKEEMATMRRVASLLGGIGASVADKGGAGADTAALLKEDNNAPPKLGDEAMWGPSSTLSVRKGDTFVEIAPPIIHDMATHKGMPIIDTAEKKRIAIAIAEKVLAKLPG